MGVSRLAARMVPPPMTGAATSCGYFDISRFVGMQATTSIANLVLFKKGVAKP